MRRNRFSISCCRRVVLQGQRELARYLLEHGANANAVSRYNHHSAHAIARLTGRTDIAELLEKFGANPAPLSVGDQFRVACGRRDRKLATGLLRQQPQCCRTTNCSATAPW